MTERLSDDALSQLFLDARSRNAWKKEVLPESTWHELYEILRMGPTSANVSPARFVFITSDEGKARIAPLMSESNAKKSMDAPAIVIIAQDMDFAEKMDVLFPHNPGAASWFSAPEVKEATAFRNSTLQGAYLMLAARALGLDCGPMSGFDNAGVDAEFFAGTSIRSNFLCTLGHGIDEPFDRLPRLPFEDACEIL
ncbi:malonic semialdehyde reductase [Croceicoccus mobilis]|uniref:NADH dehydrogenase/NAD(P)H nitroreductase n=1 Tax=Croceicoccus mobilis TaxID=1703339 RepID=A0A916Z3I1_9SPHN|nr:malonic semialdehyde reductase [Croceicoccus mobilis]GGD74288.1 putative NADH dehydrogenase/NAD(P)H nitroreductase [Croceicoccus mobilis]